MLNKVEPEKVTSHAINSVQRPDVGKIPAPIVCEGCGKVVERRDYAINVIMQIGSPGHPELPAFQCLGGGDSLGDHWACSMECYESVAIACIREHMRPALEYMLKSKGVL